MMKNAIERLRATSEEIVLLTGVGALLEWDQETNMPPLGAQARAKQLALIAGETHKKLTRVTNKRLIEEAEKQAKTLEEKALVREFKRDYEKATKLPTKFVQELSELTSKALEIWKEAKIKNDFQIFETTLGKIVEMKIRQAELSGYKESPYDALLDDFEPEMTEREIEEILEPVKNFSVEILKKIGKEKGEKTILKRKYNHKKQLELSRKIAEKMGYKFEAGHLTKSAHPFTTEFGSNGDVRITTWVGEKGIQKSLLATIHETGHALYEQGVDPRWGASHLGGGVSLGIHESQSRLWENMVGRSGEFWEYWWPQLVEHFPGTVRHEEMTDFVKEINRVEPSLIRTEADELTYNLHIILRFEIERDLIKRKIRVKDLSEIWNEKTKKYFGITPEKESEGVLQDIHWAMGAIGYFPTYTLGNLYAAQWWDKILKDKPGIKENFRKGDFSPLLGWLRENIHQHGKIYSAKELVKKVTGEKLNSKYLLKYLEEKFKSPSIPL